jgi:apolipoprotein N-acyltransferase
MVGSAHSRHRAALLLLAPLVGHAAGPGVFLADGSALLAALAVALWGAAASTSPGGRRGLVLEWLAGGLWGALILWWTTYVVGAALLWVWAVWGLYLLLAGALLRRLRERLPLTAAIAFAWTSVEALRAILVPPIGLGWLRLGHHAAGTPALAGSARVWGVEGLTFALAALGGLLAALLVRRRARPAEVLWGLTPLALAALLAQLVPPPAIVDGPRVLLVQPGFEQERKQYGDPWANLEASARLSFQALGDLAQAGEPPVDLVVWGESMLSVPLLSEDAEAAVAGGAQLVPWEEGFTTADLGRLRELERRWVRERLVERLPDGVSFAAGAEYYAPRDGLLRRHVAAVLYDPDGVRGPPALKHHLVPLGETMLGLERFAVVRSMARAAAGYVPDFRSGPAGGTLELRCRDGRSWRLGGSVCFDNAFPGPYVAATRAGAQLHLVVSNEAWYRESCEMDQMVAFSRLAALSTGLAMVRATNSGLSLVIGPDGRELGRVRDAEGRDRATSGWGAWTVPVPAGAERPPFVRLFPWIRGLALALALAVLLPRRSPEHGG